MTNGNREETNVEITVDVDIIDVLAEASDEAIKAEAEARDNRSGSACPSHDPSECELWEHLRAAAHDGDAARFLSTVEELAWAHHDTFLDTSRLQLDRDA